MKRRSFIASTGMVTACLSSGVASANAVLSPNSPWHFNESLDKTFLPPIDEFAAQATSFLSDHGQYAKLTKSLVNPINIIEQDITSGYLCYENAEKNMVKIQRTAEGHSISIH